MVKSKGFVSGQEIFAQVNGTWTVPLSSFGGTQSVVDTAHCWWGVKSQSLESDQPSFKSCCPSTDFVTSANYLMFFNWKMGLILIQAL